MFRPTCFALAPDGALYLTDWHGRDDESDQTGRVLKIIYTGTQQPAAAPALSPEKIAAMKPEALVALLGHPNHLTREWAGSALGKAGGAALESLGPVLEKGDAFAAAQAVWTLVRLNSAAANQTLPLALKNPDARVRAHALRQLRQSESGSSLAALASPLLRDPDGEVRVEAALAMDSTEAVGRGLLAALETAASSRLRYQIGFELGRRGDRASLEKLHAATDAGLQRVAMIAADTARHEDSALAAVVKDWTLPLSSQDAAEKLIANLQAGQVRLPETSDQLLALEWLAAHPLAKPPLNFFLACLQDEDRLVQAAALRATRRGAVDTADLSAATLLLLGSTRHTPVQVEAVYTLGAFADAGGPEVWVPWLKNPSQVVATAALRALRQRERKPEFVNGLWATARETARRSPRLTEEAWFTFRQLGLPEKQLAELPARPPAPADKNQLAQAVLSLANGASALLGEMSFNATRAICSACHSVQPGESTFGPSLADLGADAQPQYLIESILEPGKVIKTGYQIETVETKSGRVLSGLVGAAGTNLVIRMLGAAPVTVPLAEVKSRATSAVSPMPPGLEATMTRAELADLTAYLLSLKGSP